MMIYLQSRTLCYCIVTVLCLVWISSVSGSYQCSCYTFAMAPKPWSYGKSYCTTRKGDLVSMETVEEWEFIKTRIQSRTVYYDEWWIGLEKRDGEWKWLSNHTLTYNKWQPYEPNMGEYAKCVLMAKDYPPKTYGLFADAPCDINRGWICEYKGKACSGGQVKWCNPTSSTTKMTTHHVTKRPLVKTATSTPYDNKPTQHTSIMRKKSDPTTPDHHKLVVVNTDCIPYPLLVTAIFVCVLGGLTVLGAVAFFLVPFLLKKRRSSID